MGTEVKLKPEAIERRIAELEGKMPDIQASKERAEARATIRRLKQSSKPIRKNRKSGFTKSMRILQGLSASDGTIDDRRPNYFWYVCPEGIISEAECPKFAGLMYITDSGTFRCIKSAPCLHKAKYDTQADLLRRDMRDKFYYAMWNWIRRYWRNIGKAKDIAPQTAAAYERALDKQVEEVADLKYRLSSLTQWRDIQADPKWGFATDDAIDEIFRNLPRLVRDKRDGSIELIDYDNAAEWRGDLERKPSLYQWLPINGNTL